MSTPLLTLTQLRALEHNAIQSLGNGILMARAGAAAAQWITERWPDLNTPILILCGPGNNGGDGFACALDLIARGYTPKVAAWHDSHTEDARQARACWLEKNTLLGQCPDDLSPYTVVVDALYGIGMSRALSGADLAAAQRMSCTNAHILALDCPSGLDAEHGCWVDHVPGVHADTTLTFIAAKPGLYTGDGTDACGRILIDSLELTVTVHSTPTQGQLNDPTQFQALQTPRKRNTHKGSYGRVGVVGGNQGMVGAALLAARSALRLGAGRVYVHTVGTTAVLFDPTQPELMMRPLQDLKGLEAIVMGCGLGTDERAAQAVASITQHLSEHTTIVVDADALPLFTACVDATKHAGTARFNRVILTPHPLEAARLLHCTVTQIQNDRIGAAQRLAQQTNSIVILKGAGSVIATSDRYWINTTGNPALASAGTGDVLAGMIGALAAQGLPPLEAALAATWLHGAAADLHGFDMGLVASDIPTLAIAALRRLRP